MENQSDKQGSIMALIMVAIVIIFGLGYWLGINHQDDMVEYRADIIIKQHNTLQDCVTPDELKKEIEYVVFGSKEL